MGAVLVDRTGAIIAAARNRRRDETAPPGQLAGSAIAHAEMNVLATLPPKNYAEFTLYTTLEPCLLCTSALRIARVGTVRYAAADAVWTGVNDIPTVLKPRAGRHWTKREGPIDGVLAKWSGAMHAYWLLENSPGTLDGPEPLAEPHFVEMARKLVRHGVFELESQEEALRVALALLAE